jgi:hypothetical protein
MASTIHSVPAGWKEMTKGFDSAAIAKAMVERDLIIPGKDGKPTTVTRLPGHGSMRFYRLAALADVAEGEDADHA